MGFKVQTLRTKVCEKNTFNFIINLQEPNEERERSGGNTTVIHKDYRGNNPLKKNSFEI